MTCLAFTDLCAGPASAHLVDHLAVCPRCRAIVARLPEGEASASGALEAAPPPAPPPGPPPAAGGVWTFWSPRLDEYVVGAVLDAGEEELLIAPVLFDTGFAAEADVVLPRDNLGYAAHAPVWASDRVLTEQAVEAAGVLSEQALDILTARYEAFFASEPIAEADGPPMLGDDDPRVGAHAALADDLRSLYAPWAQLHVADELGPVVAHRRDEAEFDLASWSEQLGVEPRVWSAFEAGQSDPYVSISARVMAHAIRGLGLLESRRVVQLARTSVLKHHVDDALTAAPAKARRRRGVVSRTRQDPEAAAAAAVRYADALTKELGL